MFCRRQREYEINEKSAKLYRQKSTLNKFDWLFEWPVCELGKQSVL